MIKPIIFAETRAIDGKKIDSKKSGNKQRILVFLRSHFWESALLRVTYKGDFVNEGDYSNYPLAKEALDQFLEQVLLDEF